MTPEALINQPDADLGNLCKQCSTIDLDDLFTSPWPFERDCPKEELFLRGIRLDDTVSSCTMCELFKAVDPPIVDGGDGHGDLKSVAIISPRETGDIVGIGTKKSRMLAVANLPNCSPQYKTDKMISIQSGERKLIKLLDPQYVDFRTIKDWLSICLEKHNDLCGLDVHSELHGLRVINVRTKKLEFAERQTRYVTLSYVWGQQKPKPPAVSTTPSSAAMGATKQEDPNCLPDDLPSTIQDAMATTERLGFEYLWIDRYCIPQQVSSDKDKHDQMEQIKQMEKIYRNSELTIIAAAGEGPEYGLPGVGSTARVRQPHHQFGNYTLVSTMESPKILISNTRWDSRAWTYQEVICSRRRLVFTDEQVFFECQQMSCRETVSYMWPLEEYRIFHGARQGGIASMLYHIEIFTSRQLTFDSDALNAILGVLRLYSERELPVFHFWGIPMTLDLSDERADFSWDDLSRLQDAFIMSLSWKPATPARRRPGFPSWSWTGWECKVSFDTKYERFEFTVSIGYKDGSFKDLEYAYRHSIEPDNLKDLSKTLRLRGNVLNLMTKVFLLYGKHRLFVWPMAQHEAYGDVQLMALATVLQPMDAATIVSWNKRPELVGIIMGCNTEDYLPKVFVLLVSKVDTTKYHRVGHLILSGNDSSDMYPTNVTTGAVEPIGRQECDLRIEKWLDDSAMCDIDLV